MSWRSGLTLAVNVLGVGALFLPWTASADFGSAALLAWGWHVLAGLVLVVALLATGAGGGVVALIGSAFGDGAARAINACYVVGITAGQVVVALVAGDYLAQALGVGGGAVSWLAIGVLAVSAAVAGGRWTVASLPIFVLVVLALVVVPLSASGGGPGIAVPPGSVGAAAVLQCFAVVGWESAARQGDRRRVGPVLGVLAVGVLYGGALLVAPSVAVHRDAAGLVLPALSGGVGRVLAGALALVVVVCCLRNIRTVARLGPPPVVPAVVAVVGVLLVRAGWFDALTVLAVPNAMACAVFLTGGAASTVGTAYRGGRRVLGAAAVLAYLPMVWFLGVAALAPVVVTGVTVLIFRMENKHAPVVPRSLRRVRGDGDRTGRR